MFSLPVLGAKKAPHVARIQVWHFSPSGFDSSAALAQDMRDNPPFLDFMTFWKLTPGRADGTFGDTAKWHHALGTTVLPLEVEFSRKRNSHWGPGHDNNHWLMDECIEYFQALNRKREYDYVFWRIYTPGLKESSPEYFCHTLVHGDQSRPRASSPNPIDGLPSDVRLAMLMADFQQYAPFLAKAYIHKWPLLNEIYTEMLETMRGIFPYALYCASEKTTGVVGAEEMRSLYLELYRQHDLLHTMWSVCYPHVHPNLKQRLKAMFLLNPSFFRKEKKHARKTRMAWRLGPHTRNRRHDTMFHVGDAMVGLRLAFACHFRHHEVQHLRDEVGPFEALDAAEWGPIGYTLTRPDLDRVGDLEWRRQFVWTCWVEAVRRTMWLGEILFTKEQLAGIRQAAGFEGKWLEALIEQQASWGLSQLSATTEK